MARTAFDLHRLALAAPLVVLALAVSASAGTPPATVSVGRAPALGPSAGLLGALAPSTSMDLTVVLSSQDPVGLAALATAVSTPGSPDYRHYLSVAQFAQRFGASPASVAALRATLEADGLDPGALAPDGLSLSVSGDAGHVSQAFGVSLRRYRQRSGREVYANTGAPRVPGAFRGLVTAVLGLDDVPTAAPASLIEADPHRAPSPDAAATPLAGTTIPAPCSNATAAGGGSQGPYTIDRIAAAYGISGLYANGDLGAGSTIALYELEPYLASDLSAFQSCYGTSDSVTNVAADGGPGPPGAGSGETALDLDNLIGLAPQSAIDVYQGPDSGSGPYLTFAMIVNQDTAQVISDSWGLCEPMSSPSNLSMENTLFQQAAVQGQSLLVASGDTGADGCEALKAKMNPVPPPSLAVDDAASQPYATGVGGTALTATGPPASESVWNDGAAAASGGGISAVWPMPSYQASLGAPGVIGAQSSGAPCGAPAGYCREVPDVSAEARPSNGYVTYYNGAWHAFGGTSAGAPVWAALIALANASAIGTCSPADPLGFLNPKLYAVAAGAAHAAAFNDVTTGNTNQSGLAGYPATAGYDMASGLGTPHATSGASAGLVAQLCNQPALSSLSVADAPPGTAITLHGSGFAAGASVAFGATAATAVTIANGNQLSATVPPGTGTVDVSVTTAAGTSPLGPADRFTYAPTESITAPAAGATYTQTQSVLAAYSCAASTPAAPSCAGPLASGSPIDTTSLGAHQFSVSATDANGVSTTQAVGYTVIGPPSVSIAVPAQGATYTQGQSLAARFSCTTAAPVTIVSCSGAASVNTAKTGVHSVAVAALDSNGVSASGSASYSVIAARPTITALRESASRWLTRRPRGTSLPIGTSFTFRLDQAARVTLRFARSLPGRIAAGRCVATTAGRRHLPACTRSLDAGTLTLSASAGATTLRFSGRTSRGTLAPGAYVVALSAVGLAKHPSSTVSLHFTVLSPSS